ncbi:MAG TPA: hypothetical protein VFL76_05995 [Edaphocola sp.]|nr:hypothetical protein [Edaphocola sp.]
MAEKYGIVKFICTLTDKFEKHIAKLYFSIAMKNWKLSLLTAFGFFAICAMVVFNSCEKDPCMDLNCKNGSCVDGLCQCPTGWEGAECDIPAASRFLGTYTGSLSCDNFPIVQENMSITLVSAPNEISLHLPFGNSSVLHMEGIAETPETHFVTHVDPNVDIHAYVTVDGDLIYVYLETIDKQITHRQICRYTGHRISN